MFKMPLFLPTFFFLYSFLFQFVTFHLKEDLASVIFHITSSMPHRRSVKSLFMAAAREMEIISKPSRAARISVSVSEEQCLVKCVTQWDGFHHCHKAGQSQKTQVM